MKKYNFINKLFYLFLIWRVGLFIIAWLGGLLLKFQPSFPYSDAILIPSGLPSWIWSFGNFDGVHYITIAKSGYSAQFTQVFFPLYPLLIRLFSTFLPFINPVLIGLFISNIAFLASLILFYKLLKLDYNDNQIMWIIIFTLLFPASFFFGTIYTEGVFFLLLIASLYTMRFKRWYLSAILASLAGVTRLVGIFLLPALLWEWYRSEAINKKTKVKKTETRGVSLTQSKILNNIFLLPRSPILYIVPLGILSYMVYLQISFGDFLYFWHAQPIFGAERSGGTLILLPQVIWRYIKLLASVPAKSYAFWVAFWEITSSLLAIALLIIAHLKKVRISYLIFSWLAILTPTLTGTFSSMPRYVLAAFPIFITLGLIKSPTRKTALLVLCVMILILFTILFTRGHWVS